MEKIQKPKTRYELMLTIAIQADHIEGTMLKFSKLFPEFNIKWLLGVEANYNQFLNYCSGAIKAHEENKKSK